MSSIIRNTPGQNITFVLINVLNGQPLLGANVSVSITLDNSPQITGVGTVTEKSRGQYNYSPTQSETNALDIGFLFEATNAIPVNYDFHTGPSQAAVVPSVTRGSIGPNQYLSRSQAQIYFSGRLGTFAWDSASLADQDKALIQATNSIEQLNFAGCVTTKGQIFQFPRGGDTQIPQAILNACCEIALKLLNDVDIDLDANNVNISESRFSLTTTKRDTTQNPSDWVLAGIPSLTAWNLLRPFLRDPYELQLNRVN